MALRIAGAKRPLVEDPTQVDTLDHESTETPQDEATESPDMEMQEQMMGEDQDQNPEEGGGIVDPNIAGYQGPENGPFKCGNCMYFSQDQPNTCHIVAGAIEAEGCCNLFTAAGSGMQGPTDEEQGPEEPTETPDMEDQEQEG